MGKTDPTQSKLPYAARHNQRGAESSPPAGDPHRSGSMEGPPDDYLRAIMLEVRSSLKTINAKIDTLQSGLDSVKQKVVIHKTRLDAWRTEFQICKTPTPKLDRRSWALKKLWKPSKTRTRIWRRVRRNNLRILGLPESTAITKMETYIEHLLKELFGPSLSSFMLVERAHRSLAPKPVPSRPPRPIIARLLNYGDRDAILREAGRLGSVTFQGNTLMFFPDYTPTVQAARREFAPAKKLLAASSIQYAMMYPAKLKIVHKDRPHYFTDAKSAPKFAKTICARRSPSRSPSANRTEAALSDND